MSAAEQLPEVSIRELIKSGAHFGHRKRFWHPSFRKYIFGVRNNLHIINLDETKKGLLEAARTCREIAAAGSKVMFVCTKPAGAEATRLEAERCDMPHVTHRWLGGLLSNYKTISNSVKQLKEYEEKCKPENLRSMTKKEGLRMLTKLRRLQLTLNGVRGMPGLPQALFVIDAGYHHIAIREARKIGMLVIAVVDTNYSVEGIDVVIPGNDDSTHSIGIYLKTVADAVIAGHAASRAAAGSVADNGHSKG